MWDMNDDQNGTLSFWSIRIHSLSTVIISQRGKAILLVYG